MEALASTGSRMLLPVFTSSAKFNKKTHHKGNCVGSGFARHVSTLRMFSIPPNGSVSPSGALGADSGSAGDVRRKRSSLESLLCYDKAIPEERIEKPVGVALDEKSIGDNKRCANCQVKGAVLCTTCSGSGLYVDSILESQGIIVKVRCLGCGGTGNIMCSECGGRGHLGHK